MGVRLAGFSLATICLFWGQATRAESVTRYEFKAETSGYPCTMNLEGSDGTRLGINLSDYKDVWSIAFFISGIPAKFLPFFDNNNLFSKELMRKAVPSISIGDEIFKVTDATLFLTFYKKDVGEKTTALLEIEAEHQVVGVVQAMNGDGLSFGPLASFSDSIDATAEFRACALDALGVADGEAVETDFREEFRLIFEDSFEVWLRSVGRAEGCGQARVDDDLIAEISDRAASAFYPGILNMMKRGDYSDGLKNQVPLAMLGGLNDALKGECLMSGSMAEISRMPVEKAIEAAEEIE